MVKHLFCDLDGTLIVNYNVSQEDKDAIQHFVNNGGHFHIITGRTLAEIDQFVRFENLPAQYRIGNNGCQIVKNDQLLLSEEIDKQISSELKMKIEPFVQKAKFFEVTAKGNVYYTDEVLSQKFMKYKENNLIIEPNLFQSQLFEQGLTKMYMEADAPVVSDFLSMLDTYFDEYISHYGEITNVNVGPKDVSKGSALNYLKTYHGLDKFAVIGDGANDIPMFNVTEHSYSFHRAHPMVSQQANHQVHSVAEAVEQIMKTW